MSDIKTKLVHSGEPSPRIEGAVSIPIFQSATFCERGDSAYHDLRYIRLNNTPNHLAVAEKISAITGGEDSAVMASGMAAITTTLMTLVGAGDHIIAQNCLYGGTRSFLSKDAARIGVEVDFFDGRRPESWAALVRPETKALYCESISNPLTEVAACTELVAFAKRHGLVSVIDNTFASPVNFNPLALGFDLEIHSATKYLNGHSDIVAGAVSGRRDLVEEVRHKLNHLGGCLDPNTCFLLQRGLKTLALRVAQQNLNASALAGKLEAHPQVERVHYPGLQSHPDHLLASALMRGFGGVLSFEVRGGIEAAKALLAGLSLPIYAPSLGGVETLITLPALSSHSGVPAAQRGIMGITDSLLRVAVGIEDEQDLWEDFSRALDRLR